MPHPIGPDGLTTDRVWWCATGPLTRFPLHAAGQHELPGRSVLDRTVSSETSTLRLLADTRRRAGTVRSDQRLLAVGVPTPAGRTDELTGVMPELHAVQEASTVPVTSVDGPHATRHRVLAELATHHRFHFAGHGIDGLSDPANAALLAADTPITLADLAGIDLTGAELAFLSCCHGADSGPLHADEALHLAAAAQAVGFRHVVATRHAVDDDVAGRVAAGFYREPHAIIDPAVGLHRVLHRLRAELRAEAELDELVNPLAWIHYVHAGPAVDITP